MILVFAESVLEATDVSSVRGECVPGVRTGVWTFAASSWVAQLCPFSLWAPLVSWKCQLFYDPVVPFSFVFFF